MTSSLHKLLFPEQLREIAHRRLILNVFRILHILCFSIYLGGLFFAQDASILQGWLWGAILSGLALFLVDLYSSCILLFEVRGISVLIKILILLCLPYIDAQNQLWLVIFVVVFSSYISHSSRRLRHRNLLSLAWKKKLGVEHLAEYEGRG